MISVNVQRAKYSLTGKTCSVYQKRPERLYLRPWFYKYFCGEVFVDQIGVLSITTLLQAHHIFAYVFFSKQGNVFIQSACSHLTSMFFL